MLYEGYLLYPYRATSGKNQSRWQFGVLGPPGAEERGIGENTTLSAQFLLDRDIDVGVRRRAVPASAAPAVPKATPVTAFRAVDELTAATSRG